MTHKTLRRRLRCACGDRRFLARILVAEGVGLLTCAKAGHPSLLLDSREHWHSLIQRRKPRESVCGCRQKLFEVELTYALVDGEVRTIEVTLHCAACGAAYESANIEIDWEPTRQLIEQPLDPCPDPWTKARWFESSGFLMPVDIAALTRFALRQPGAVAYLGQWRKRARPVTYAEVVKRSRGLTWDEKELVIENGGDFNLFLAAGPLKFPADWDSAWKELPIVEVRLSGPIGYQKKGGRPGQNVTGLLYYISYARERRRGAKIIRQAEPFLAFADRLHAWLGENLETGRGSSCFDNAREYQRLKPSIDRS